MLAHGVVLKSMLIAFAAAAAYTLHALARSIIMRMGVM